MISRGSAVDVIGREGGHAFDDYLANGSALLAFAWLLDSLHQFTSAFV
jgi:hypothetical protein